MPRIFIATLLLFLLHSCRKEDEAQPEPKPVQYTTLLKYKVVDSTYRYTDTYPPYSGDTSISFPKNYVVQVDSGMSANQKPYWIVRRDTFSDNGSGYILKISSGAFGGHTTFLSFKGDTLRIHILLLSWQTFQESADLTAIRQ